MPAARACMFAAEQGAMLAAKQGGTCGEVGAHGGQRDGDGRASGTAHAQRVCAAEHEGAHIQGVALPFWQPLPIHAQQLLEAL